MYAAPARMRRTGSKVILSQLCPAAATAPRITAKAIACSNSPKNTHFCWNMLQVKCGKNLCLYRIHVKLHIDFYKRSQPTPATFATTV